MSAGPRAVLLALLVAAVAVRIWALDFCLPSSVCRPDERTLAAIAGSIAGGDPNPHFFSYPSLYLYALGLLNRLLLLAGEGSSLLLAGRMAGVAAGCLTVLATFFLARRLGSPCTGLVAATLLAFNYLHVRDSHFMATDGPAALLAALALMLILRAMERGGSGAFALAGAVAGLAASTKYNVGAVAGSLLAAHGLAPGRPRRLWLGLGALVAAFVLTSPFVLLDLGTFVEQFGWELRHFRGGMYPGERESGAVFYYLARILPHGLGLLPLLLAVAGCIGWIVRRDRRGLVVLVFVAAYSILIGSGTTVFARYLLPLMPPLCAAAACGLERLCGVLPRFRRPVFAAALLLTLLQPLSNIVAFDRLLGRQDTREQAAAWMNARLEPGAVLQLGGIGVHHWVLDPIVVPAFRLLIQDDRTQERILSRPLSELADRGVRYVLTHEHPLLYSRLEAGVPERLRAQARQLVCFDALAQEPRVRPLYDYEDAFYVPFARFGGVLRPGPRICIYAL